LTTTIVRNRYQVTIPKEIRKKIDCQVGDLLEVIFRDGHILMIPQRTVERIAVEKLNPQEQQLLKRVQNKMKKINTDHENSIGLTEAEIEIGVRVGLINTEEAWWWAEEWQRDERKATSDIAAGRVTEPMERNDFLKELDSMRKSE